MEEGQLHFDPETSIESDGNVLEFSFIKDGDEQSGPENLFPELCDPDHTDETLGRFIVTKNYEIIRKPDGRLLFRLIIGQVRFHVFVATDIQSLSAQHASILAHTLAKEMGASHEKLEAVSMIPFEGKILRQEDPIKSFLLSIRDALKKICLPVVGVVQFVRDPLSQALLGIMRFQRGSSMGDFLNGDPLLHPDFFQQEFLHELKKHGIPIEAISYTSDPSLSRRS